MVSCSACSALFAVVLLNAFPAICASTEATATKTVSFSGSSPSDAAEVPANFVGFGFEGLFLNYYNNDFSKNLVNSVAERMSAPPVIRVGGTSSDHMTFIPSQKEATKCLRNEPNGNECPWGSGSSSTIGPSYFDGFKAFSNCHMTFQVALGPSPNFTNAAEFAKLAYNALGEQRTAAIALGNEVEYYDHDASAYITDALKMEQNVIAELNLKGNQTQIFEVMDLGSSTMDKIRENATGSWDAASAFEAGLDQNGNVKVAAAHWYQADGLEGPTTLQGLMDHAATVKRGEPYISDLNYLRDHRPDVSYALTETAAMITNFGSPEFASTFGACLWSVDWQMYCMSKGIKRIAATQRPVAHHSLWIPVANATGSGTDVQQVRAPYYAQPFIADFIGNSSSATTVTEMDLNNDYLTAYAAYEGSTIARIALVNLKEWSQTNGTRDVQDLSIALPSGIEQVRIARLAAGDGAYAGGYDFDKQNITYAGQQWSKDIDNGKGHPEAQSFETAKASGGKLSITLPASEAAILHLH